MSQETNELPPLSEIEKNWIKTPQAAEVIGMSKAAVIYACLNEKLRAYKLGGQWYIDPLSARQYIRRKPSS